MRGRLLLGIAMLVVACAVSAFAQDKVKLEHKRKKGDKLTQTGTNSMTFLMQISAPGLNQTNDGTLEISSEQTEEVTDAGSGVLAIRRTGKETSKMTGGPAPNEETRALKSTTFRFAPTGKLISADVDAFSSKKMGLDATGDVFNYVLDQIPVLDEFPDRELSVGEEWTNTHILKNPDGSECKVTIKHRLFGLEPAAKRAWIVSETKIPFNVSGGPGLAGFKMTGAFETRSHTLFSYGEGKPVKSTDSINFDVTIEGTADGATITVKIVGHGTGSSSVQ